MYNDIIGLPHFVSEKHPQMSIENRAAQFSPFAALTGYEGAVKEQARLTDEKIELDDEEKLMISSKLQLIQENIKAQPEVTICYFQADERKDGGAYVTVVGYVKKVDEVERVVRLTNGTVIFIDEVISIDGEVFKGMEEGFA